MGRLCESMSRVGWVVLRLLLLGDVWRGRLLERGRLLRGMERGWRLLELSCRGRLKGSCTRLLLVLVGDVTCWELLGLLGGRDGGLR